MKILKIIYVLAIAAFLTMLVAFGISAFYQPPEPPPTDPSCLPIPSTEPGQPPPTPLATVVPITPEQPPLSPGTPEYEEWQRQQEKCQDEPNKQWEAYNELLKDYHRNVFAISYPCALLFIILGLSLSPRLDFIKPGLLLGGIATMFYAIAQPQLATEFRFIGVAVGLVVLFYLGYKTLLERKTSSEEKT